VNDRNRNLKPSPFKDLIGYLSDLKRSEVFDFLDTRDFKQAPNWLAFCLDHLGVEPFPRQIEVGIEFFMDKCPRCSNPKYNELYDQNLGNILDNVVLLHYGKCKKCGLNRNQIIKKYSNYYWREEMVGVAGQRSGKSELAAMCSSYVWQWYAKLPGIPSRFFGQLETTKLHMTFTAITVEQVRKDLWDPFTSYISNSKWFKDYHKCLNDQCQKHGIEPVVKIMDTYINYKHKNMRAAPEGPDKRKLRGPTRILGAIDELGWFTGDKRTIKINPDETYAALNNSLKTLRAASRRLRVKTGAYHIPTAYSINISSPSSARDGIMRLLYKSRKINSMYSFHFPTWEFNPTYKQSDFKDEFDKNPIEAKRDFGALPPLSESPFLSDSTSVKNLVQKRRNCLQYVVVEIKNKSGTRYVSAILNKIRPVRKPMLLGLDAGYTKNAFALTLASYTSEGKIILEGACEIKPIPGRPVSFVHIYKKVIVPILKTQRIIGVFVDRWQSIDIQQRIEDEFDIPCTRYSLKYGDFEVIRSLILGERTTFPKPEIEDWSTILKGIEDYEEFFIGRPISHFLLQLLTVQDTGRRVEKSGDIDDDIFRAFCLCIHFTQDDEYRQLLLTSALASEYEEKITIGVCRKLSMAGMADRGKTQMAKKNLIQKSSVGLAVRKLN